MRTVVTRSVAAALAAVFAVSCASCSLLPGGFKKDDIIDAAEDFADTLIKCDADKIIKLTEDKKTSKDTKDLEELLDTSDLSKEDLLFIDAVADTLGYEIDEDSVDGDKESASIDVTFNMVDYEDALEGNTYNNSDEVIKALDSCDKVREVQVTFEFVNDDGEWLISNIGDKSYKKIFDFYGFKPEIMPDLASLVMYTDIATGSGYVDLMVVFEENVEEYLDLMTCTVTCDNQTILTGEEVTGSGEYVYCGYYVDGMIPAGYYTVYLKCGDNTVAFDSVTVADESEIEPYGGGYEFGQLEGDTYIADFDITENFENNYLDIEGYDVEMEGILETRMYLKLGDGQYELWVDEDEFKEDMYAYLEENSGEFMSDFLGVSKDELDEYAESLGYDSYSVLEDTLIQAIILDYFDSYESWDYGTYTVSGDKITFTSSTMDDFTGTVGDGGSIALDFDFLEIVFYPEGSD